MSGCVKFLKKKIFEICTGLLFVPLVVCLLMSGCVQQQETGERATRSVETLGGILPERGISVGMSQKRVLSLVGHPAEREIKGEGDEHRREVWYYDFGVVIIQQDVVKYVHQREVTRPSRSSGVPENKVE